MPGEESCSGTGMGPPGDVLLLVLERREFECGVDGEIGGFVSLSWWKEVVNPWFSEV